MMIEMEEARTKLRRLQQMIFDEKIERKILFNTTIEIEKIIDQIILENKNK